MTLSGDSVFMPEWQSKEEYVLNDQGLIWRGTHNQMKTTHWNFAQVGGIGRQLYYL